MAGRREGGKLVSELCMAWKTIGIHTTYITHRITRAMLLRSTHHTTQPSYNAALLSLLFASLRFSSSYLSKLVAAVAAQAVTLLANLEQTAGAEGMEKRSVVEVRARASPSPCLFRRQPRTDEHVGLLFACSAGHLGQVHALPEHQACDAAERILHIGRRAVHVDNLGMEGRKAVGLWVVGLWRVK